MLQNRHRSKQQGIGRPIGMEGKEGGEEVCPVGMADDAQLGAINAIRLGRAFHEGGEGFGREA